MFGFLIVTDETYDLLLEAVDDARILAQHRGADEDAERYDSLLNALRDLAIKHG